MRSPERVRAVAQLERVRRICDAIEIALRDAGPPGHEGAQAITQEAISLAMTLARITVVEQRGVADGE